MAALVATSAGRTGERKGEEASRPLRRCVVTRRVLPKERLIRFALDPEGNVVADLEGQLPGRGIWLQASRDVVETACAKGSFAKAARAPVKVPEGLADRIEGRLRRRCLDLIGLARRAGQLAAGFERAGAWLRQGRAGALVAAIDGAEGGRGKLANLGRDVAQIELFSAAELGAALGRDHAVHIVLSRGTLARRLVFESLRLLGFASSGKVTLPPEDHAGTE
ncbi:MAG TPA: RNA-binding protein [Alphaproteobacteria bacterium]|nr:RNA-binding protein [Alphaproteobacteria bacterium]